MFRILPRKTLVLTAMIACFALAAFTHKNDDGEQDPAPKNLKVLPKNISADSLHELMESYSHELGVTCGFCHAKSESDTLHLDFASDANGMKKKARFMIMMTSGINDQYFAEENFGSTTMTVNCFTCHHGQKEPEIFQMPKE
ncbi:MAG: c-type cytochrome [Bacteroidetes bacterium]|nr:c-type cytochrome [Bacteroidota bacterium]